MKPDQNSGFKKAASWLWSKLSWPFRQVNGPPKNSAGLPSAAATNPPAEPDQVDLLTQALTTIPPASPVVNPVRPGHYRLTPARLPQPTYWPPLLALGIVFLAMGIVTLWPVSLTGLLLFCLALAGWIGELRNERREREQVRNRTS